ncbi:hybrid sensor histidine kinase/response regulator [Denitromonas iodatirespirans]|uniref:hybrid sensor histidine kinase/response regulator n=1 Tax=Denitromonas iodatirespirans TaxID=2795389 RepID=UPI001E49729A|nr:ATP-binding protein [Denitromonas iodatirespirans]
MPNTTATPSPSPLADDARRAPAQRVIKVRRDYNSWVARETLEDYALRFTPHSFRKWSEMRVANTAFGASAFLVLEAVGGALLVSYGFWNAFWAILATGLIIFLAGVPISQYAARYGLDMDLLTRGAGFGYLGSTITSLIYASFTFIFFALEAAIMAYALELALDIPPAWGYLICALVVIPLVTHGVTVISWLQVVTQPLWIVLLVVPFVYVLGENPGVLAGLVAYPGTDGQHGRFDLLGFGAALTVGIALITQMGEQVDYLRFMPERTARNRRRWTLAVLIGGPGWVVPGVIKMLGGAMLAYLAISHAVPPERALDPNQMYLVAYEYVFSDHRWAVAATLALVVVSQLKINVTNAYAGSLAWSNFFARLTHSHPGRVVWVVFNTGIALALMELDVFQALGRVLGLYSNIAISWLMVVVADLVINKPLGLSPPGIEFKRAHLYDINPVGVGAMLLASALSVAAYFGLFGDGAQAFSALIALVTALVASPLIAWATGGRYYIARTPDTFDAHSCRCVICEREYEADDISRCPAYGGPICSLCCSLDARCHDQCKPHARLSSQWTAAMQRLLPERLWPYLDSGLGHYLMLMAVILPFLALLLGMLYYQELRVPGEAAATVGPALGAALLKVFAALVLVSAVVAWWLVLTHKSRQVAQEESNRQTALLMQEIEDHRRTDDALQQAKQVAELANQAKSRYITAISHELRTPLNSILGYAQILDGDEAIPPQRRQAISVIRRSGDHLLSLIEGTLDIARIEGGKLTLEPRAIDFPAFLHQIVRMFELQATRKDLSFDYQPQGTLPAVVRADEKRLRQILINLLGNAVKFTERGGVRFGVHYAREMGTFTIEDSGPGIAEADIERVFEPFGRGSTAGKTGGAGLGLTISRMFADVMGGELKLDRSATAGTRFIVRLFLPQMHGAEAAMPQAPRQRTGYEGPRKRILIVDNERDDREMLAGILEFLGFKVTQAASGLECLKLLDAFQPDLIFMDLAMPGIDGWESIRRIRQGKAREVNIAVLSANAFDKGLDNDVGLPPEDFILKPFKMDALLDWIGQRLGLTWTHKAEASPPPPPGTLVMPPDDALDALADAVEMGYVRGILAQLDAIEARDARYAPFAERIRQMATAFEFDAIMHLISQDADV